MTTRLPTRRTGPDAWDTGYAYAHDTATADRTDSTILHPDRSHLWRIDFRNGLAVHDSYCGDHDDDQAADVPAIEPERTRDDR